MLVMTFDPSMSEMLSADVHIVDLKLSKDLSKERRESVLKYVVAQHLHSRPHVTHSDTLVRQLATAVLLARDAIQPPLATTTLQALTEQGAPQDCRVPRDLQPQGQNGTL